jgi:hypothetical protein
MKMIELAPDLAVIPCPGMVLKGVDEDKCALFTPGQSAVDGGFLINRPFDEALKEIDEALEGDDGDEEE